MTKPKVLLIYTGGTIGMIKAPETGALYPVDFQHIHEHVPELMRLNVALEAVNFHPTLDSSEMTPKDWIKIGTTIMENYNQFDGFVVLHGSDTMAYSASALSFMLEGLQKPVIFTGSQLPIGTIRTDGKENLITAIEIAAEQNHDGLPLVREVAVYFDYKLFRGNRCTKDSAENFEAFRSPNYDVLAEAGVQIKYNLDRLYRSNINKLIVKNNFNTKTALLKLYPGIDFSTYQSLFDKNHVEGLVIETFGSGNAPQDEKLRNLLMNFINQGGVVLNITQCNSGTVKQGLYATSSMFNQLGVISGYDLTTEAAVTKMMFVLGETTNFEDRKALLSQSIRGEMTIDRSSFFD